ncbi:MAG: histidine--tRNA ligase [Christensenellales bacterium]|jgi:histidyl-tRNA synthetase
MLTQAPKGTKDMLPRDAHRWQSIEELMRGICATAGYREVRTPMFEHTELFLRGVGDTTDVVQKEMYTFLDKGERSITLKPEGTAGVARAFIEAHLYAEPLPLKMCYISNPVFRYDKPQAGRYRQHHQLGVEVFGAKDASCDAEVIRLAADVLNGCGLIDVPLHINSIGCPVCRAQYQDALRAFLAPKLPHLCKTCADRFERNPMRILDCKEETCQKQTQGAPAMLDMLCADCDAHFQTLQKYLAAEGLEYTIDPRIVRGLDYYTKTVFEFITQTPTGPLTVCGGGRYDGLIEQLGGPATPGMGFGMGVERIILEQDAHGIAPAPARLCDAFVVTLGDEARLEAVKLVRELRQIGVRADLDHAARSMKAQFKYADKIGARHVIVIAGDEIAKGVVKLRDMQTGTEAEVAREEIAARMGGETDARL